MGGDDWDERGANELRVLVQLRMGRTKGEMEDAIARAGVRQDFGAQVLRRVDPTAESLVTKRAGGEVSSMFE